MKRIRKVIASALTLVMSILVMCVGVYAAASAPKISISGSISYDVGECKVRVIGNLGGAYLEANGSGITPVEKTAIDNNGNKCHYYGVHDNAQSETNLLPAWNIGSVYFKETANGVENFVVNILVENLSVYPIKVIVSKDEKETAANIQRTEINNNVKIDVGETASIDIIYDIKNNVAPSLLVGNQISFEKTSLDADRNYTITYVSESFPFTTGAQGREDNLFESPVNSYQQQTVNNIESMNILYTTPTRGWLNRPVANWYTNPDLVGTAVKFPYILNQDLTLYAQWETNYYEYKRGNATGYKIYFEGESTPALTVDWVNCPLTNSMDSIEENFYGQEISISGVPVTMLIPKENMSSSFVLDNNYILIQLGFFHYLVKMDGDVPVDAVQFTHGEKFVSLWSARSILDQLGFLPQEKIDSVEKERVNGPYYTNVFFEEDGQEHLKEPIKGFYAE